MADISWSAGIAQLNNFLEEEVEDRAVACLSCDRADASRNVDLQTFAQPAISVVICGLEAVCMCTCVHIWACACVCVCVCVCVHVSTREGGMRETELERSRYSE